MSIRNHFLLFLLSYPHFSQSLVWPKGNSRLQIITGLGVPVDLKLETVIIGAVIKGNYKLPSNTSQILPFGNILYARRKRSLSRWSIYELLAQMWQQRGFGGKPCLLRVICELAHRPIDKRYGLFNEIIHTIFRPSETHEKVGKHDDYEYYAAEQFGTKNGKFCEKKFAGCSHNLVDFFTM